MTLLAEGALCRNQAVRAAKNAYGFQGHPELTREMLESWIAIDPTLVAPQATFFRLWQILTPCAILTLRRAGWFLGISWIWRDFKRG